MSQILLKVHHPLPGGQVTTTVVGQMTHLPGKDAPMVVRCRTDTMSLWGLPPWRTWRLHEGRFLGRRDDYRLKGGDIHRYEDQELTASQVRQDHQWETRDLVVVEGQVWSSYPAPTLVVDTQGRLTVDRTVKAGPGTAVAYLWQHQWVTRLLEVMGSSARVPEVDVVRPDLLPSAPLPSPGAVAARLAEAHRLAHYATALREGTISASDLERLRDDTTALLSLYRLETNPTHPTPHEGATHA